MNKKHNSRALLSINKIKNTTQKLIKSHDITNLSISKFCEIADINRTTFYSHFDSIYDVIMVISHDMILEVFNIFNNENNNIKDNISNTLDYILNHRELVELLIFKVDQVELKVFDILKNFNLLRKINITTKPQELILIYLISGFKGILQKFFSEQNTYNKKDFIETIYNLINWDNPLFK